MTKFKYFEFLPPGMAIKISKNEIAAVIEVSYRLNLPEKDLEILDRLDAGEKEFSKSEKRVLCKIVRSMDRLEERKYKIKKFNLLKKLK